MKNNTAKYILLLLAIYIILNCCTQVIAAPGGSMKNSVPVAPERNYERETATFPSLKDKTKKAEPPAESKPLAKSSAITNGIIPMIVMGVIVLGIFLWIGLTVIKKLLPGGKKLFSSPGLEILGRTHFDSQKYLALVRVGTRVLVVGVSPNGFDQISEISDSEEVTDILSAAKPRTSSGQNLFYKMFQKQIQNRLSPDTGIKPPSTDFKQQEDEPSTADTLSPQPQPEIAERQERIRKIRDMEV